MPLKKGLPKIPKDREKIIAKANKAIAHMQKRSDDPNEKARGTLARTKAKQKHDVRLTENIQQSFKDDFTRSKMEYRKHKRK